MSPHQPPFSHSTTGRGNVNFIHMEWLKLITKIPPVAGTRCCHISPGRSTANKLISTHHHQSFVITGTRGVTRTTVKILKLLTKKEHYWNVHGILK